MPIRRWLPLLVVLPALLAGAVHFMPGLRGAAIPLDLPGADSAAARATLANSKYTDVAGIPITLAHTQPAAMVFVFMNTECPISNKLVPELNRLAKLAGDKKIEFYGVLSDPAVSRPDAQKHSAEYKITFPMLFDASGTLAAALQPTVTPHAFVVDPRGKLIYSGRIDDSYAGVGEETGITKSHDLQDAITAAAAGKTPAIQATTAVGCTFESWKHADKDAKVTWSRDIAPLVYANCTACHHEGEVAPFSLMTYKDASKRVDMLALVTQSKQMPPWKATDTWGTFHDERRLTPAQVELFQKWADAGAPEGDKPDAPTPPTYKNADWQLGKPDLIVKMAKPFNVPADGRDIFAFSVIPLKLPADQYVVGFEYHPGNRKVVHHMIAFLDATGAAEKLAKEKGDGSTYLSFGGPGFTPTGGIGGWAPGAPRLLPEGVGHRVAESSSLVLNIHYHPIGKAETDQGEIALYFAKKPVQQVAISYPLTNRQINIPPGDNNYTRTASITTPVDVTLLGITPHMHMLGREMKVTATFADGRQQQLIYVNDWDWNWQDQYQYSTPIKLPRGTKVDLWARYDNSKDNPKNPQNPPQRVTFGEQTSNEMCFAFLQLTVDGLRAPLLDAAGDNTVTPEQRILQRLQQLRANQRGSQNP